MLSINMLTAGFSNMSKYAIINLSKMSTIELNEFLKSFT